MTPTSLGDLNVLDVQDFNYELPESSIALFSLEKRDASSLLVYKDKTIQHSVFQNLGSHLPEGSFLVMNNTKVLPARLHFQRKTGSWIEVLIVHYETKVENMENQFVCQCLIGNKKKWQEDEILEIRLFHSQVELKLEAKWYDRTKDCILLTSNQPNALLPEILSVMGEMPIPPYLKRAANEEDKVSYQTIYAKNTGAIAAPTAGLHFTDAVFEDLKARKIETDWITLHVGIGTFMPMKTDKVAEHEMHEEEVVIGRLFLENLKSKAGLLVAVGTTSIRSLESLFWLATELKVTGVLQNLLQTEDPYLWNERSLTRIEMVELLLDWMSKNGKEEIRFFTKLYIMPGYRFRLVGGLITNFHQPKSTLVVLISAFVGEVWKQIYAEAVEKNYRFLSYGDSSLLLP